MLRAYASGVRCAMMDTDLVLTDSGIDSRTPWFATSVFGEWKREFSDHFGPESMKTLLRGAANRMAQTTQKNIRFTFEEWKRVEKEAEKRDISPNRLVVELAIEGLERREWPRTEAEIHLLRSAMFTAQAIIRDMERDGREEDIELISRNISEVAPELPEKSTMDMRDRSNSGSHDA